MSKENANTIITTETLLDNISNNLSALLKKNKITQKKLHEITGASESTVSEYVNGRKVPSVEFFVRLKQEYGISIDDFIMTESNVYELPDSSKIIENKKFTHDISKFVGTYLVYYYDTSSYKGRDESPAAESITYGVIKIFDNSASGNGSGCIAVMGIKTTEEASEVKSNLDNLPNGMNVFDYVKANYKHYYNGMFDMTENHAFISLSDNNKDKVFIILHRVMSNKKHYIGGLGTINSVSKGREQTPVVQYIGFSRNAINLSEEEISHNLLLDLPKFTASYETEEMIKLFRSLYLEESHKNDMTEHQKTITLKANLERHIQKIIERNIFRYSKISNKDDNDWYQMLKESIELDSDFES